MLVLKHGITFFLSWNVPWVTLHWNFSIKIPWCFSAQLNSLTFAEFSDRLATMMYQRAHTMWLNYSALPTIHHIPHKAKLICRNFLLKYLHYCRSWEYKFQVSQVDCDPDFQYKNWFYWHILWALKIFCKSLITKYFSFP